MINVYYKRVVQDVLRHTEARLSKENPEKLSHMVFQLGTSHMYSTSEESPKSHNSQEIGGVK